MVLRAHGLTMALGESKRGRLREKAESYAKALDNGIRR